MSINKFYIILLKLRFSEIFGNINTMVRRCTTSLFIRTRNKKLGKDNREAMTMDTKQFDILVFGATGFTGKFVTKEISNLKRSSLKWAIAGRDEKKLEELKKSLNGINTPLPTVLIANVKDQDQLNQVISKSKLVIDCVGPFRYWGEIVVKACVEFSTDYVDINGETEFVEKMFLKYNQKAQEKGISIVTTCGFDCIPTEMGNVFIKKEFQKRGFVASSVECYVAINSGPTGSVINYATYESAVQSISHIHELRALRKQMPVIKLPIIGKQKLKILKNPRFEPRVGTWVVPFMGADSAVIKLGQQIIEQRRQKDRKSKLPPPTQVSIYFATAGFVYLLGLIWFGLTLSVFCKFSFGRKLLLKYPGFFSFGAFSRQGPTDQQIKETTFMDTFIAKGYTKNDPEFYEKNTPDFELVARVTGPEPGYVTTPITVVACAFTLLDEKAIVPSGVLTPSAAFIDTNLIDHLKKRGIQFSVVSTREL